MKKIIVTTSVKTTLELNDSAQKLADELNLEYVKRNKTTIKQLLETAKGVIVVYKNKLSSKMIQNFSSIWTRLH